MDKATIRQEYLQRRRQLSPTDALRKSALISQRMQSSVDWSLVHTVHIYDSQASLNEVDTLQTIAFLHGHWPQIGITLGEASPTAPIPSDTYDVILVPIVAFDTQRNRLGYGGGWYDRFLAAQPQAMTIGLAYSFQQFPALPTGLHDIALSQIVTESAVI